MPEEDDRFDYYVIFGAAVRPDGSPSGTLRRRVEGAFAAARDNPARRFLPSGGVGRFGAAEAEVMRDLLLDLGADPKQIVVEDQATDTLETVANTSALLRARGDARSVAVCTSPYHLPRCRLLFRIIGIATVAPPMPSDRDALGTAKWLYYWCREVPALAWDVLLLILRKA